MNRQRKTDPEKNTNAHIVREADADTLLGTQTDRKIEMHRPLEKSIDIKHDTTF